MPNTWSDPYASTGAGGATTGTPGPRAQYRTSRANNASEQVLGLYQQNFGRSAAPAEIEGWVRHVGGGDYLSPEQLNTIHTEFQRAPEYSQYRGTRPTMSIGDYIHGVTLGTSLSSDPSMATFNTPISPGTPENPGGFAEDETTNFGMQSQVRDSLLRLLNQPAPTAQDPSLAPAISAFNQAQNKASARQVAANAEAFGASGLESSGARLGADRGVIEQQGLNEGTFASNLVVQQLERQRQETLQALQLALATHDQDVTRRLQERLAQLQAAIQREGLANQKSLGEADIALRQKLGMGNLNLGVLGLAQQGRQFNDSLGFNLAQLETSMNNEALQRLLFGG